MGRPRTKVEIVNNCVAVFIEDNATLAMKFAEYHIKNWHDMPCFRGSGLSGKTYSGFFFTEATDKILEFFENSKFDISKYSNFKEYK